MSDDDNPTRNFFKKNWHRPPDLFCDGRRGRNVGYYKVLLQVSVSRHSEFQGFSITP